MITAPTSEEHKAFEPRILAYAKDIEFTAVYKVRLSGCGSVKNRRQSVAVGVQLPFMVYRREEVSLPDR